MDLINNIPTPNNSENFMDKLGEIISAVENVEKDMMKKLVRKHIEKKLREGTYQNKTLQSVYDATNPKAVSKHKFITINFKPDFDPKDFNGLMDIINKKKWMVDSKYALEQRSEDETKPDGYHVHIILKDNKKNKSEIIRELGSTCKNFITGLNYIDVQTMQTDNVYEYLLGDKKDKSKRVKQEVDRKVRSKYGIIDSTSRCEAEPPKKDGAK